VYRWVEHTAEIELAIEAASESEVFEDALAALSELLDVETAADTELRPVVVCSPDRPALLAAWLEELVFLAESEGFVATAVQALELRSDALTATITGVVDDPPPLVKAVTYHRLEFESSGSGYVARVVLDV
jgi:SHS2 domain-containing protein